MTTVMASVIFVVVLVAGLAYYFTPSIIAVRRQAKSTPLVMAINFLTGWTLIGWVLAFGMAFRRGDNPLQPKYLAFGCGIMVVVFAVYEFVNLMWLHVPAA